MRITNTIREAFVASILQDTPQIDYDTQIREAATKWLKANVPADLQKVRNKYPEYFTDHDWIDVGDMTIAFPILPNGSRWNQATPKSVMSKQLSDHLKDMIEKRQEQTTKIKALSENLRLTAMAYNTVKQMKEALPELAKYLPNDEAKAAKNLPAVSNTIADLVAAGWPKDKATKQGAKK